MSLEADEESPLAGRSGETALAQEEEETGGADWATFTKSLKRNTAEAFIPRRGEKDYAPIEILADVQATELEAARRAMFEALEIGGVRQHSSKQHNRAVWHPSLARAAMDPAHMNSIHLRTMGRYHSERKRTELLPEEALYLVERGTLECWTEQGIPMSAQHAFTAMLGAEGLTNERYQVYAYLRRLGYAVLRADLASMLPEPKGKGVLPARYASDPLALLYRALQQPLVGLIVRLKALLMLLPRIAGLQPSLLSCAGPPRQRMKPFRKSLVGGTVWRSWHQIFAALQVIPAGHDVPLSKGRPGDLPSPAPDEPYRVFFHIYKPITKFKKTDPPAPDFYLAVIDARTTPLFSLEQITALIQSVPMPVRPSPPRNSWLLALRKRLPTWLGGIAPSKASARAHNPFPRLKAGRRNVVLAIVDSGTSSFLRLAEGEMGTLPLLGG